MAANATSPNLILRPDRDGYDEVHLRLGQAVSIGRSIKNAVVLKDGRISKHHCTVTLESTSPVRVVLDDRSVNGVFVNGARVQPDASGVKRAILRHGSQVSFDHVSCTAGMASLEATPRPMAEPCFSLVCLVAARQAEPVREVSNPSIHIFTIPASGAAAASPAFADCTDCVIPECATNDPSSDEPLEHSAAPPPRVRRRSTELSTMASDTFSCLRADTNTWRTAVAAAEPRKPPPRKPPPRKPSPRKPLRADPSFSLPGPASTSVKAAAKRPTDGAAVRKGAKRARPGYKQDARGEQRPVARRSAPRSPAINVTAAGASSGSTSGLPAPKVEAPSSVAKAGAPPPVSGPAAGATAFRPTYVAADHEDEHVSSPAWADQRGQWLLSLSWINRPPRGGLIAFADDARSRHPR